jgi:manganese transport protein
VLAFAIYYHGNEAKIEDLLTMSQVFLSIALPFAMIPLVMFTSNRALMGNFTNRVWVKWTAWIVTVILIILNIYLILQTVGLVK